MTGANCEWYLLPALYATYIQNMLCTSWAEVDKTGNIHDCLFEPYGKRKSAWLIGLHQIQQSANLFWSIHKRS